MRLFYSNLQLIGDRAECLRSTQRTHRQTHDHPFYWAPFVLVGDPHSTDPLPSKSSRPNA
jgi:CHAT domain-containing protein